jgi:hypothetical protein
MAATVNSATTSKSPVRSLAMNLRLLYGRQWTASAPSDPITRSAEMAW